MIASLLHHCAKHESIEAFPLLLELEKISKSPFVSTFQIWQMKIVEIYVAEFYGVENFSLSHTIDPEFLKILSCNLEKILCDFLDVNQLQNYIGKWKNSNSEIIQLQNFTGKWKNSNSEMIEEKKSSILGPFLVYFDLPTKIQWNELKIRDYRNLRSFLEKLILDEKISLRHAILLHRVLMK